MSAALTCPDCGEPMELRSSRFGPFYGCTAWKVTGCNGSHGAHPDGSPLGVPATAATKQARIRAHEAFDKVWQSRRMKRKAAYRWLQDAMGLTGKEAHIGSFNEEQCARLIEYADMMMSTPAAALTKAGKP